MRLLIARHGATDFLRERRFQGQLDVPLSQEGRLQAEALAAALAATPLDAIVTSDLSRARETADIVARGRELTPMLEPRLRECSFGEWEGRTSAEAADGWPEVFRGWRENGEAAPGGEDPRTVLDRAWPVCEHALAEWPGGAVLLVTHAVVAQRLLGRLLGLAPEHVRGRLRLDPAGLSEAEIGSEGRWRVCRVNWTPVLP